MGGQAYTLYMDSNDTPCGGCMAMPPGVEAPSHWAVFYAVDDVDAIVGQGKTNGAQVLMPGADIPSVGRIAMLADPQGAAFGLVTPDLSHRA